MTKTVFKKTLSLLLAVLMIGSLLPVGAFAAGTQPDVVLPADILAENGRTITMAVGQEGYVRLTSANIESAAYMLASSYDDAVVASEGGLARISLANGTPFYAFKLKAGKQTGTTTVLVSLTNAAGAAIDTIYYTVNVTEDGAAPGGNGNDDGGIPLPKILTETDGIITMVSGQIGYVKFAAEKKDLAAGLHINSGNESIVIAGDKLESVTVDNEILNDALKLTAVNPGTTQIRVLLIDAENMVIGSKEYTVTVKDKSKAPVGGECKLTFKPGAFGTITEAGESGILEVEKAVIGERASSYAPAAVPNKGFKLVGWYPDLSSPIKGDTTYEAQWAVDEETIEEAVPEADRINKNKITLAEGVTRKYDITEDCSLFLHMIIDNPELVDYEVTEDAPEEGAKTTEVHFTGLTLKEGETIGDTTAKLFFADKNGKLVEWIYPVTVRSNAGLLGATNTGSQTIYDNEVGAILQLYTGDNDSKNKCTITRITSDNEDLISFKNLNSVFLPYDGNSSSTSSKYGVAIKANHAVTADTKVKVTIYYTKGTSSTVNTYTYTVTVKPSKGVTSTVTLRIVNGKWNTSVEGINPLNVSEDGTTITFVTYPDTLSGHGSDMYYFNCSRTHDTSLNTTNCVSMEKVLLAILGKDKSSPPDKYITANDGYYVDFDYQDWTIEQGNAINNKLSPLFDTTYTKKSGRSQMSAVQGSIHSFDDNGHTSGTDAYGFEKDTVYTLTLLKNKYTDDTVDYTVEYRRGSITGQELAKAKTVIGKQPGENYTENALGISGYTPDEAQKSITPTKTGTNKIIFVYTKNNVGKLKITKTSSVPEGTKVKAGDEITYTITVKNDGAVDLTNVVVDDPMASKLTLKQGDSWNIGDLAAGASKTITATYKVTEDDVKAGGVTNVATVSGTDLDDDPADVNDDDGKTEDFSVGHLKVTKTSNVAEGTKVKVDDVITYTITVLNDGKTTLTNIEVEDNLEGVTLKEGYSWKIDSLAPGISKDIVATYKVTEADVKKGSVTNAVTAKADGNPYIDTDDGTTEDPTVGHLTITKTSGKTGTKVKAGEGIIYTIEVTNDGTVDLKNITVVDELKGVTLVFGDWNIGSLAAGESKTITATYKVTEADVKAGGVTNVATVSGKDANGDPADVNDKGAKTEDFSVGHMKVTKTSDVPEGTKVKAGDTITYTITVENDGPIDLINITVDDALKERLTVTKGAWTIDSLESKESYVIVAKYTVTEDDEKEGTVMNTATASGEDEGGNKADVNTDDAVTRDPTVGHMTVTKTSDKEGSKVKAGDVITYTITVENDGKVALQNVTVKDKLNGVKLVDGYSWTIDELDVGDSKDILATYTVTEADVLKGSVTNAATASGEDEDGDEPDVNVGGGTSTVDTVGHLTVVKKSSATEEGKKVTSGDTITYTITVTNDGKVDLQNVTVTDKLDGVKLADGYSWTIDSLAAGKSTEILATYKVTNADVKAGKVDNVVTVTGTDTDGYAADSDNSKGTTSDLTYRKGGIPSMGDDTAPNMWLGMMFASLTAAAGSLLFGKKKRRAGSAK